MLKHLDETCNNVTSTDGTHT